MVWLTFRQHRIELGALFFGACAIALAILAIVQYVLQVKAATGVYDCPALITDPVCGAKVADFARRVGMLSSFWLVVFLFPALVASFLAGPLFSRDFENGTHRLAWTQGITRMRWVTSKFLVVLAVALVAGLVIAAVGGQMREFVPGGRLNGYATAPSVNPFTTFDFEGPVVVSYLLFAVAIGALASAGFRRSVPAMFVGLVGFVTVRGLVEVFVRPGIIPPVTIREPSMQPPADAWNLGVHWVTSSGAEVSNERIGQLINAFNGPTAQTYGFRMNDWFRANDAVQELRYQPAERYWALQSIEAAIFLGLTVACVLLAIWLVRRRPV